MIGVRAGMNCERTPVGCVEQVVRAFNRSELIAGGVDREKWIGGAIDLAERARRDQDGNVAHLSKHHNPRNIVTFAVTHRQN